VEVVMSFLTRTCRRGQWLTFSMLAYVVATQVAALDNEALLTRAAIEADEVWRAAMVAILADDDDAAEEAFGKLLEMDVTPLRLAMLEVSTTRRGAGGGAVLLMEQDAQADRLSDNAQQIYERLLIGREQRAQANDGWYFASLGRFDIANANFVALLDQEPDPVALLEFSDEYADRHAILLTLVGDPTIGESVKRILAVLREGERRVKADPLRIRRNIERLSGPPRAFENGIGLLVDSGEYAIPALLEVLGDANQQAVHPAILLALPKIDRPALNPLLAALDTTDQTVQLAIIRTLGKIGYGQAKPYLRALANDQSVSTDVRSAASTQLHQIASEGLIFPEDATPAECFFRLALYYYDQNEALAADPRLETANVWYWRDSILQNVPVPTAIFDEVMAMGLCERALKLDPTLKPALALWLAANFRRAAELGNGTDATRPDDFPPPDYFAVAAGSEYCQLTLAKAVRDRDPAVALGAIAALQRTAGPATLLGVDEGMQPMADALQFPNRLVRIRAALALANARPQVSFKNAEYLMPVLSETLRLHAGMRYALVIDRQQQASNIIAAALRENGFEVVVAAELVTGMRIARDTQPGIDVVFLAEDIGAGGFEPSLDILANDFQFASAPVVLVQGEQNEQRVKEMSRTDGRLGVLGPNPSPEEIVVAVEDTLAQNGAELISPESGVQIASEAVAALTDLAISRSPLFIPEKIENAVLEVYKSEDAALRLAAAKLLAEIPSAMGQEAVAKVALSEDTDEDERVAMFDALAMAAKNHGNKLPSILVSDIRKLAEGRENVKLRTAAAQVLGALNLPTGMAIEILKEAKVDSSEEPA
jgi:HEAT repeat protein